MSVEHFSLPPPWETAEKKPGGKGEGGSGPRLRRTSVPRSLPPTRETAENHKKSQITAPLVRSCGHSLLTPSVNTAMNRRSRGASSPVARFPKRSPPVRDERREGRRPHKAL